MTKQKCDKYETLFTFATDDDFQKHLLECEDCRHEQEKMNRVSELIAEVKPQFVKRKNKYLRIKIACILCMVLFAGITFETANNHYRIVEQIVYGEQLTPGDLGFPTDSYGLIMVDE